MTVRRYSSISQETSLVSALNATATTMVVNSAAVLGSITPAAGERFTLVLDPDTALEEIVYAVSPSSPSSTTITIIRGVDGTGTEGVTGVAHSAGAKVRHMAIGVDFREANQHIENTTTAHGITLANIVKTTDTGTVTSTMITDGTIVNADINASAAIADTKLDTISTASKVSNSATTATSTNTASAIVARDASGNFTAGTVTANLTGNVIGNVTGNVTGTSGSTTGNAATATALATGRTFQLTGDVEASGVTFDGTGNVSLTTVIGTGAIVNADVNTSAQIAYGKLNLTNSIVNGDINASAAIALSKLATDPLARANHTGTQTASTVSDFDTQVRTSKVTDLAAPTGSFSMNSQKITSLGTPTSSTDAATKAYADLMIPLTQKGVANGVAELDADGLVPTHHLPALSITTTQVVSSQAAMLALTAQTGDVAVRTDVNKTFILTATPASTLGNWQELLTPTDSVLSVDGLTGAVNLSSTYATVANAANKLPLAGGTMSGAIAMGTNKITGVGDPTSAQDVVTKNYLDTVVLAPSNLTGPITSVGAATSVAAQTGTGSTFVMNTSPTLVTPVLGVATATSINSTTIPSSKTLVATDSTQYVVPSQTGNSGKYLTTDGTTSSWAAVNVSAIDDNYILALMGAI
jgi:hypothetical protein